MKPTKKSIDWSKEWSAMTKQEKENYCSYKKLSPDFLTNRTENIVENSYNADSLKYKN